MSELVQRRREDLFDRRWPEGQEWIDLFEFAAWLNVAAQTLQRLQRKGRFPSCLTPCNGCWRIDRGSLRVWFLNSWTLTPEEVENRKRQSVATQFRRDPRQRVAQRDAL